MAEVVWPELKRPLVLYHGPDCFDGFCCAWIMHRFWPGPCDFQAVTYRQPAPDVTGRVVFILDFSYPRATLEAMHRAADQLIVLDHHKTAEEELAGLPYCVFDMERSGAELTWAWLNHIFDREGYEPPWLVRFTADRDLWRWALPKSREVNAALRTYPMDFDTWDKLEVEGSHSVAPGRLEFEGGLILQTERAIVRAHVARAVEIYLGGHMVLAVNATCLQSEIAGELAKGRPFGAVFSDTLSMVTRSITRKWDLRSDPDGVDVSAIAVKLGGGGHKHAAGFEEAV